MDKLSLITSQNSNGISVINNGEFSSLINFDSGNISGIFLKSDNSRPIRCSELNNKLSNRKYNLWNIKYISTETDDKGKTVIKSDYRNRSDLFSIKSVNPFESNYSIDNLIPLIATDESNDSELGYIEYVDGKEGEEIKKEKGIKSSLYINSDYWDLSEQEQNLREEDPSIENNGWFNNYSSTKKRINLVESGTSLTIINRESDTYTDTVDFRDIINYSRQPGLLAYLTLEVGCTIEKTKDSYEYFTRVYEFSLFQYLDTNSGNGELKSEDFILETENGILIEFIDGILRVISSNSQITECIINNCILEYGKLN